MRNNSSVNARKFWTRTWTALVVVSRASSISCNICSSVNFPGATSMIWARCFSLSIGGDHTLSCEISPGTQQIVSSAKFHFTTTARADQRTSTATMHGWNNLQLLKPATRGKGISTRIHPCEIFVQHSSVVVVMVMRWRRISPRSGRHHARASWYSQQGKVLDRSLNGYNWIAFFGSNTSLHPGLL